MGENFKYDAFISYRHKPLDLEVAKRLHKLLETYVAPKNEKLEKRKLKRVFRDQEELPTSSNLGQNIYEALESSRYLIVICSPDTPKSEWVQKEIETFINLHGYDRILALLIDGEPSEAFPNPLRFQKRKVANEKGEVEVEEISVEVEPLAADIRAKSRSERYKCLDKEKLRLLAPILGCSFDDLKQRDKERRMKRLMILGTILTSFLALFGVYNAWQADRYQKQRNLTQEANVKLQEQVDLTLMADSLFKSDNAKEAIAQGDLLVGTYLALDALPKDMEHPDRPYVPEAEEALHQALYTYQSGAGMRPSQVISHRYEVVYMKQTKDNNYLLTQQENGHVILWQREKEQIVWEKQLQQANGQQMIYMIDDNLIVYRDGNILRKEDLLSQEVIWEVELPLFEYGLVMNEKDEHIYIIGSSLTKYSIEDGAVVRTYNLKEDFGIESSVMRQKVSQDGKYMCLSTMESQVFVVDLTKGQQVLGLQMDTTFIRDIDFNKQSNSILVESFISNQDNALEEIGEVVIYDVATGEMRYKAQANGVYAYADFNPYEEDEMVLLSGTKLQSINYTSKEVITEFYTQTKAQDSIVTSDLFIVATEEGHIRYFFKGNNEESYMERIYGSMPIKKLSTMKDGYYALDVSGKHIIFYQQFNDTNYQMFEDNQNLFEAQGKPIKGAVSQSGTWYGHCVEGTGISIWDMTTRTNKSFISLEEDNTGVIEQVFFEKNQLYAISSAGQIYKIDPNTSTIKKLAITTEEIESIDRENSIVLISTWDKYYLVDLETMTVTEERQINDGIRAICLSQGTVYVTTYEGAYKVSGATLEKILDLQVSENIRKTEAGIVFYNEKVVQVVIEGQVVYTYESPYLEVRSALLLPDGKHLALSYDNKSLVIRNRETNKEKILMTDVYSWLKDAYISNLDDTIHLVLEGGELFKVSRDYKFVVGIKDVLAIDYANKQVIVAKRGGSKLPIIYPYYTTAELIDRGKAFLRDKTISDIKKEQYFIK